MRGCCDAQAVLQNEKCLRRGSFKPGAALRLKRTCVCPVVKTSRTTRRHRTTTRRMQCASQTQQFASVVTADSTREPSGRCTLLCMPASLVGRAWPAQRMLMGLSVCQQLRRELPEHADGVLLVTRELAWHLDGGEKDEPLVSKDGLLKTFGRVSHLHVSLKWRGPFDTLIRAVSMSKLLVHLDFTCQGIKDDGVGTLAE
eukprot:1627000-Rhodomonas_salina.1